MDAATIQALQQFANKYSGALMGVPNNNYAPGIISPVANPAQNTDIGQVSIGGQTYYYSPSTWGGNFGTASISPSQATALGGVGVNVPGYTYSTTGGTTGGSYPVTVPDSKGYFFTSNPGGGLSPGAHTPTVSYTPGTGGGFAGLSPDEWTGLGLVAAGLGAGVGGAALGLGGTGASAAGEAGAGGVMGSGALGTATGAAPGLTGGALGGTDLAGAGLSAIGSASFPAEAALPVGTAEAGSGAAFGVGAAGGSGAGTTGSLSPMGFGTAASTPAQLAAAAGNSTLASSLATNGLSGAATWITSNPLQAGALGLVGLSALSGSKPNNTATPAAPGQGFISGTYNIAQPRQYNAYTGDYAHYAEPGGGMGHEFFTPVNNLDTTPLPNTATPKAKGGPLSMMDAQEAPQDVPLGALGQASAHLVRGPGSGQADLIPAQLSDGEYVIDADAVSALGDGSNEEGARRLDHMRENLRKHKRSAKPNSIPPKAKSPLQYMTEGA